MRRCVISQYVALLPVYDVRMDKEKNQGANPKQSQAQTIRMKNTNLNVPSSKDLQPVAVTLN